MGVPQMAPHSHVESSLVLMVGKQIPVVQGFNTGHLKDLSNLVSRCAQQIQQNLVCLAGGLPSNVPELFRSSTDRVMSDIVVGVLFNTYLYALIWYLLIGFRN